MRTRAFRLRPGRVTLLQDSLWMRKYHCSFSIPLQLTGSAFRSLGRAVEQGLVSEEAITEAIVHNLTARFALGDIDNESIYDKLIPDNRLCCSEHNATSLHMARESMVLLQNKDEILPLAPDAKVALLGPNAGMRDSRH